MSTSTSTQSSRPHPGLKTGAHTYLSPQATLVGTYPITLGPACVIQLRAKLVALHGPVSMGEGSVVCERSSVGVLNADGESGKEDEGEGGVVLGKGVVVECGAVVEARVVGEGSVVEVGARVGRGAVVGKHCKISPLCVVAPYEILPDRTIVYGGGGGGGGGSNANYSDGGGGGSGGEQEQQQRRLEPEALQGSRARVLGKHVEVLRTLMGGK